MRNQNTIMTIDLHIDTQQPRHNGLRTSVHLQKLLKSQNIENIIVRSAQRKYHDVGAWCFLGKKSVRLPKTVDIAQHRPERSIPMQNLVSEVITMACSDKTAAGAGSKLADFAVLLDFCNSNDLVGFLSSPESYQSALEAFTFHLRASDRKPVTQAKLQSVTIECGSYLFPLSKIDFSAGIERIQSVVDKSSSTKPPPEAPVTRFVSVFDNVFNELADFILNRKDFPKAITIDGERAIVSTEAFAIMSESQARTKACRGPMSPYVDYTTGRCKPWTTVLAELPSTEQKLYREFVKKSLSNLQEGNTQLYCQKRRRLHKLAHDSFVALFAINSGENESVLISTPWDDDYEISKGANGTRIISFKLRGGLQPVSFKVTAPFIKQFKKFIALRNHILDDEYHNNLFLGFDYRTFSGFRQLDENCIRNLCIQMQSMVDPAFPILSYKRLRAYKDSWLVKNYGHDTAAALLHHSDKTQRDNYTNVEEKEAVDSVVIAVKKVVSFLNFEKNVPIPSGACSGAKPTSSISIPLGYEPDCKNSRGCLFCDEYRTTADEESIHKLYSLEYITKKFLETCDDLDHFNLIHKPALDIIDLILKRIITLKPELTDKSLAIRRKVYQDHALTEYWEIYLSRLMKIGAIR